MFVLNIKQREQLAEFTSNLALLFFGTVIAPLFVSIDSANVYMISLGLIVSGGFLILSLLILKEQHES